MTRKTATVLTAIAAVLVASAAGSQTMVHFGGSFDLGFPQEEFRDNVDNTGLGGGFFLAFRIPDTPMAIGGSADIIQYGSEDREAPWSTTIPDVFLDVSTTNNLAAGHLFLRLQPSGGFFRPYLEGLLGFNYLWTTTSVSDQGSDSEEIASTKHLSDFAFSYGIGAGLMFKVWEPSGGLDLATDRAADEDPYDEPEEPVEGEEGGDDGKVESIGIFFDVRYMRGGEADYLREGSIEIENGRVRYDVRHSRTDMVIVRIGFSAVIM
jgi:hypothetical protein